MLQCVISNFFERAAGGNSYFGTTGYPCRMLK